MISPKKYCVIIIVAIVSIAARLHPESYYQNAWCISNHGVQEVRLGDNSRVDCLTDDYAIEFDFADKWAEAIGQAIYYGAQTNREPGIVLIMERWDKDLKYLRRLLVAIGATRVKVNVWLVP